METLVAAHFHNINGKSVCYYWCNPEFLIFNMGEKSNSPGISCTNTLCNEGGKKIILQSLG